MKRISLLLGLFAITLMVFLGADSGYYQLFNARPTWSQFHTNQFNTNTVVNIKSGALTTNVLLYPTTPGSTHAFTAFDKATITNLAGQTDTRLNIFAESAAANARVMLGTAGVIEWGAGRRANSTDYSIYDEINAQQLARFYTNLAVLIPGTLTNSALTASRAVFSGANKELLSSAASSVLSASLTDETGSGVAVFGTSPTFTTSAAVNGNLTASSGYVTNAFTNGVFYSKWVTLAYSGGTNVIVDLSAGNAFNLLITNTTFITVTNIPANTEFSSSIIRLRQNGTGTYAVTFHTNYIAFASGTQPSITTNANAKDVVYVVTDAEGTNVLGVAHANFLP